MVATGGAAALWERTTNPPGSQGVGLMLAQAAGAQLADLELLQFHPTAVIGLRGREGFLVTEAIRGEGATLHDASGERFVDELAPRDEVSRAISERLAETGAASVGLDMRAVDPAHFPNVFSALREAGLDPTSELVPVAPAAHYMMGGIVADLDARSSVPGLYAVGEASCTGLHGANRLASNSLSECFVFAARAVDAALLQAGAEPPLPNARRGRRPAGASGAPRGRPRRSAERCGGERGSSGTPRAWKGCWRSSTRSCAASPAARWSEPRAAAHTLRSDHPDRDPEMDARHVVLDGSGELGWQTWE